MKQKNDQVYEKQLRERCNQREEEITFGDNQLRSKFKRCVSKCKKVVMTIKTASGIDNFIDKKGYGRWFNQLYALVKTRDSCLPDQAIEPSAPPTARSASDIEYFSEQGDGGNIYRQTKKVVCPSPKQETKSKKQKSCGRSR